MRCVYDYHCCCCHPPPWVCWNVLQRSGFLQCIKQRCDQVAFWPSTSVTCVQFHCSTFCNALFDLPSQDAALLNMLRPGAFTRNSNPGCISSADVCFKTVRNSYVEPNPPVTLKSICKHVLARQCCWTRAKLFRKVSLNVGRRLCVTYTDESMLCYLQQKRGTSSDVRS